MGGDFGRGWLDGLSAGGPEPAGEEDLFTWGEGPKGNLSASQYAANEQSRDWLDAERISIGSDLSRVFEEQFIWLLLGYLESSWIEPLSGPVSKLVWSKRVHWSRTNS